jgi:hypothetical protein
MLDLLDELALSVGLFFHLISFGFFSPFVFSPSSGEFLLFYVSFFFLSFSFIYIILPPLLRFTSPPTYTKKRKPSLSRTKRHTASSFSFFFWLTDPPDLYQWPLEPLFSNVATFLQSYIPSTIIHSFIHFFYPLSICKNKAAYFFFFFFFFCSFRCSQCGYLFCFVFLLVFYVVPFILNVFPNISFGFSNVYPRDIFQPMRPIIIYPEPTTADHHLNKFKTKKWMRNSTMDL